MKVKGLVDEDFVNYKLPSMFIASAVCDFKCDKENGVGCCQNSPLAQQPSVSLDDDAIVQRYISNPITKAIVIAGLEPLDQFWEVFDLIKKFRTEYGCKDPVVIYTGYTEQEAAVKTEALKPFAPVIVKFGRFIPGCRPHLDGILGVDLASPNQYAKEIG